MLRPPPRPTPPKPPRRLPKGKHMTIAAGFVHREGVLLCADTELTGATRKLQASKIFHFDCALGRFAFVFAGHVPNSLGTLQKIRHRLMSARKNAIGVIEAVLGHEYRRLVIEQPVCDQGDLGFSFIFAFKPPKGRAQLWATEREVAWQESDSITAGIGGPFADQLIDTARIGLVSRGDYLTLGAYILGSVKKRIVNCGGASLFIDIGHNGALTELYGDSYLQALEEWFGVYHMLTWGLFSRLADADLSDDDFAANLQLFGQKVYDQRVKWSDLKTRHVQYREASQIIHRSQARPVRRSPKHG